MSFPGAGGLSFFPYLVFVFPSWLFSYSPAICSTDLEFDGGLYFCSDRGGAEVAGGRRISGTAASRVKGNFRDGSALRVCWVSPAVVFKLYSSDLNIEMEVRSCVSVPVSRISDGWCLGLEERWRVGWMSREFPVHGKALVSPPTSER